MTDAMIEVSGGLGLLLVGMFLMTDSLQRLAGGALGRNLRRFTSTPAMGAVSGAVSTAALQSSSATTVAVIGFVGAGLLTFPHALGVIFGANLGTTMTGWLVTLIGFELEMGAVAYPLVLVGALMQLPTGRKTRAVGLSVAGFGLVFVGIGVLQSALGGLGDVITPSTWPPDTVVGHALLLLIGAAISAITQSSSAGVAAALTAVTLGTMTLGQAAPLVIGLDIGSAATAMIVATGASVPARRTAVSHLGYNLVTGLAAFLVVVPYSAGFEWASANWGTSPAVGLVAFHSSYNLVGAVVATHFAEPFANLIERVVPERAGRLTHRLDRALLPSPHVAIEAVAATSLVAVETVLAAIRSTLVGDPEENEALGLELSRLRGYVEDLTTKAHDGITFQRHTEALHLVDHLERLLERAAEPERAQAARDDETLSPILEKLLERIEHLRPASVTEMDVEEASYLYETLDTLQSRFRDTAVEEAAALDEPGLRDRLNAARWLRRVAHHFWRLLVHLRGLPRPPA